MEEITEELKRQLHKMVRHKQFVGNSRQMVWVRPFCGVDA